MQSFSASGSSFIVHRSSFIVILALSPFVVIGDDEVHTPVTGDSRLVQRGDAAVDADD